MTDPSAAADSPPEVLYEVDGHVATITLNRPHRLNAISSKMLMTLGERLAEADDDYWASLKIAEEAHPSSNRETSEAVRRRYRMATVKALEEQLRQLAFHAQAACRT